MSVSNLFVVSLLFIMFTSLFAALPVVSGALTLSSNEEKGLLFVSEVLPFDMSK
jgi:hypothetical protein